MNLKCGLGNLFKTSITIIYYILKDQDPKLSKVGSGKVV
jgi:hypothetical protein